jgi:hypothetical protein
VVPRKFWVCLAVLDLLITGAVVGGAFGGTHKSSSSSGSSTPTSGAATSPSYGSITSSTLPTSSTVARNGIRQDSKLAALAWTVTSTRYQYRAYYQDVDNSIKESAYDSATGSWGVSKIVDGSNVTSGTAIAASSSKQAPSSADAVVCAALFSRSRRRKGIDI